MENFSEEFNKITGNMGEGTHSDEDLELRAVSSMLFRVFSSFVEAGFTEEQAITLLAKVSDNYL